jgi:hypothetical protein
MSDCEHERHWAADTSRNDRCLGPFIRDLDTPEIHGYKPDFGYRA